VKVEADFRSFEVFARKKMRCAKKRAPATRGPMTSNDEIEREANKRMTHSCLFIMNPSLRERPNETILWVCIYLGTSFYFSKSSRLASSTSEMLFCSPPQSSNTLKNKQVNRKK
jgi:hypothetical protein